MRYDGNAGHDLSMDAVIRKATNSLEGNMSSHSPNRSA
jgi:hypothetical protein